MAEPLFLPVTLAATLACLALNLWIDIRVGQAHRLVRSGRADAAALVAARQAAASAFRGNALFVLIMLLLLELSGAAPALLAVPAIVFVAVRVGLIASADRTAGPSRTLGVSATLAVEALLALGAVVTTFGHLTG